MLKVKIHYGGNLFGKPYKIGKQKVVPTNQQQNECYIEIDHNLSNLKSVIEWCQNDDVYVKQIAENALRYLDKNILVRKGVFDYLELIIQKILKQNVNHDHIK